MHTNVLLLLVLFPDRFFLSPSRPLSFRAENSADMVHFGILSDIRAGPAFQKEDSPLWIFKGPSLSGAQQERRRGNGYYLIQISSIRST